MKTTRWNAWREVFVPSFANRRLWLVQFFGTIIIALGIAGFLRMDDAYAWQVGFGFLLIAVVAVAWLMLDGGTLNYYLDHQRNQTSLLKPAMVRALKHGLPLAVLAGVAGLLVMAVGKLDDYHYSFPGYLRSEFPAWLRRHVSEARVQNLYDLLVFFLRWIVLSVLLLPFASLVADRGFRGFIALRTWARMLKNRLVWGILVLGSILGVVCPSALISWTPKSTLTMETISLVLRLLVAYLLALTAWLMVCSMLSQARLKAEAPPAEEPAAKKK
jgi:hypothetical protein